MSNICSQCGSDNDPKAKSCSNCGNQLSEVFFDLKQTRINSVIGSSLCLALFIFIMLLASVLMFINEGILEGFIALVVIWPITIGLILWIFFYLKGATKERRFLISRDYITIQIPHRPIFQVYWSDVKKIEIIRRNVWVSRFATKKQRIIYYKLTFEGGAFPKSFEIQSGREFSRKAIKKIRMKMEEFASNNSSIDYVFHKKLPKNHDIIPLP